MMRRTIRINGLSLLMIGLVAADVTTPLTDESRSGQGVVSADSSTTGPSPQRRRRRRRTPQAQPGRLIPKERVLEIQQALIDRGFLERATGTYDQATVQAMKAFQASEEIEVTGYPTAHALDRLGLSLKATPNSSQPSEQATPATPDQPEEP